MKKEIFLTLNYYYMVKLRYSLCILNNTIYWYYIYNLY